MTVIQTLSDIGDVTGKKVIVRVDMNVPMREGIITDDTRITRVLPTIHHLHTHGAKLVLLSHIGRPKGERRDDMSLAIVAERLRDLLTGISVQFVDDCIGDVVQQAVDALGHGDVLLCENLRFHAGEEAGDAAFAKQLAVYGDIYVNDAFSCSHRAHASITGLPAYLPAYVGEAMRAELEALDGVFAHPIPPVAALVGGAKVSTKMALLEHLVEHMAYVMIGGGMANSFLHAQGHAVGASLCEPDLAPLARSIMDKAKASGCTLLLPQDVVVAKKFAAHAPSRIVSVDAIADDEMALDIGPATIDAWSQAIKASNIVVWNGPVGAFETPPFDVGTVSLARIIAAQTQAGQLVSVAGGGDTVSALSHAGLTEAMSYLSTAGGAFLEWLEGKPLPGVAALKAAADTRLAG
ncbi:MAG: phosphoglycerate kinase [Sphaerospermopsis sp. SIO1G2]|nr:phosphoglycerate kinase [Sphaerospermopsis sp. SIO1G2]